MKFARLTALAVILLCVFWIGSGYLRTAEPAAPPARMADATRPPFNVVAQPMRAEPHARHLTLTGRTQSDQRVVVSARTSGIVSKIVVRRGASVKAGDPLIELSDEAREANVAQAKARLSQRMAELEARESLAKRGNYPTLNLEQLRAEKQGAEAALAVAEAELLRSSISAPITGIINDLPVEIGQGLVIGAAIAEIIAPDPILAVIEVPERRLGGIRLGEKARIRLVTGEAREGKIAFIARKPSGQTRTYRVDIAFANADAAIPDGVAAEVSLILAPVQATRVPRSALTFSSEGQLGVRAVDEASIVRFLPVALIDDEEAHIWVSGLSDGAVIITRGQEFIKEGQKVAVAPPEAGSPKP